MTHKKHKKQHTRKLAEELGISYQAAHQMRDRGGASSKPVLVLEPTQQLAFVALRLPREPDVRGHRITLRAPSLRLQNDEVGPGGAIAEVQTVPIGFRWEAHRYNRTDTSMWRFDGNLWVEPHEVEMAGGLAGVPFWLQSTLGPTCVDVLLHEYEPNIARVTAYFLPALADKERLLEIAGRLQFAEASEAFGHHDGRVLAIYRSLVPGSADLGVAIQNARNADRRGYTIDVGLVQTGLTRTDGELLMRELERAGIPFRRTPLTGRERSEFVGVSLSQLLSRLRLHVRLAGGEDARRNEIIMAVAEAATQLDREEQRMTTGMEVRPITHPALAANHDLRTQLWDACGLARADAHDADGNLVLVSPHVPDAGRAEYERELRRLTNVAADIIDRRLEQAGRSPAPTFGSVWS